MPAFLKPRRLPRVPRSSIAAWCGRVAALAVALAAVLVAPVSAGKEFRSSRSSTPDFEWGGNLAAGKTVEIKGVNGSIQAEATSGDEILVTAVKRWKKSDPDEVDIEVIKHQDGVTICAVYPSRRGSRTNTCGPGEEGNMSVQNNDVVVDFRVRVPRGVRLVARTVNGGIDAEDLDSPVLAHTVNGSVSVSTRRTAEVHTVNGSVTAEVGTSDWDEELSFHTVNGAITVVFPEDLNARFDASTVNGTIECDFPLTVQGKIGRKHITGKIGDGSGGDLTLATVNGSISVRSSN
jgi:DUF4097 and DUF4098 domain-containing protein YvlB